MGCNLRSYTKAFGYKVASTLPNMVDGVAGLRQPQECLCSWAPSPFDLPRFCFFAFLFAFQECTDASSSTMVAAMMVSPDLWEDADMASVIYYLRGNKALQVSPDLRCVLGMNKPIP